MHPCAGKNLRNVADEWFEVVSDDSRLAKTRTEQNVYRILAHTLSNTDSCFFLAHTLSNTDSCFLCPQHSTLLLGSVHDPTACVCNPGHAANVINGDGTVGSPCTSCILSNYDGRSLASHGQLHCRSLTTMRSEAGGWRMELEAKSRIEGRCAANGSATLL